MAKKDVEEHWEDLTARFELRTSRSLLKHVDEWRRRQEDLPNRSEAIRRLLEIAIRVEQRK